jgi:hypothetical protein
MLLLHLISASVVSNSITITSPDSIILITNYGTAKVANVPSTESAISSLTPSSAPVQTSSVDQASPSPTVPDPSTISSSAVVPYLAVAHAPPPVAAYAVPLSFVGAILLAAIVLAVRQHRQLKAGRDDNVDRKDFSRQSSYNDYYSGLSHQGEIKFAPNIPSIGYLDYGGLLSPSYFTNNPRAEARRQTWQAFPAARSTRLTRQHPFPSATPTPFGPPSRCLTSSTSSVKIDPDCSNASVTNLILSDYGLPTPALPTSSLTPPGRLHVRNQADTSPSYFFLDSSTRDDTPTARVPYNPISTNGSGIYDAIAYAGVYR